MWHVDGAGSALLRLNPPHSSPERAGDVDVPAGSYEG